MSLKVLVATRMTAESTAYLKGRLGAEVRVALPLELPSKEDWQWAQVAIIRSKTVVNKSLLECAPDLKLIVSATSGFDHVDFQACVDRAVKVAFTPNANTISASEQTWNLILSLVKKRHQCDSQVREGNWRQNIKLFSELAGKTLGIVGAGRIGSRVARIAQAFEMTVLAYDPYLSDEEFQLKGIGRRSLKEILIESDIVSLHAPLTKQTHGMIGPGVSDFFQPSSLLVNTARGGLVNESWLNFALSDGLINGAALDVFEEEPVSKDYRLRVHKNLIFSPHVGGMSIEGQDRASLAAVREIEGFIKDGTSENFLPLKAGWFKDWLAHKAKPVKKSEVVNS